MRHRISVIVVDSDNLMRHGLAALLDREACEVIAAVASGSQALEVARSQCPELVVIDLSAPAASDPGIIAKLKEQSPNLRVLVLTFLKEGRLIQHALRAGADGYVLKSDTHIELFNAIRSIVQGKPYYSAAIRDQTTAASLRTPGGKSRPAAPEPLSQRQRQVMRLIAEGYRTREIAQRLSLSHKTVEKHRANIMRKLSLRTAAGVAAYAIANGYLDR